MNDKENCCQVDCAPRILKEVRLCPLLGPAGINTRATTITGMFMLTISLVLYFQTLGRCMYQNRSGHSTGRVIAAGYADGSVMAYVGDYVKDRVRQILIGILITVSFRQSPRNGFESANRLLSRVKSLVRQLQYYPQQAHLYLIELHPINYV